MLTLIILFIKYSYVINNLQIAIKFQVTNNNPHGSSWFMGQSTPGSNGNEGILHTLQSFGTEVWQSDAV